MPGWKTFLIALLSGVAIALFLGVFWRWPIAVVGGVGVLTAAVVLLTSVSIGTDPAQADSAWRRAAPDLVDPPAGPLEMRPTGAPATDPPATDPPATHPPATGSSTTDGSTPGALG